MNPSLRLTALALALSLGGCSAIENLVSGERVDYRSGAVKTKPLEVPPDLTQLARDGRYQTQGGVVSASAQGAVAGPVVAATGAMVAPSSVGGLRIERDGNQRWLAVPMPPDRLWPQLRNFWIERGFNLLTDNAETGVMETDWAENRAKIPNDFIRSTIGRLFDALYSSSERDRYRVRVERSANGGSEVYISHKGLEEVYANQDKNATVWQPRANDPQLEAEMLTKLMIRLGGRDDGARAAVAAAPGQAASAGASGVAVSATARARLLANKPAATVQVDEAFDRAWRRVGLALDRTGFTVEDRDRAAGMYFVRYVDPKAAGKEEPGFFSRLFGNNGDANSAPVKYRISVKADGDKTLVSVLSSAGAPEGGENGKAIAALLLGELK